tara:strand:+ start:390 stop:653 length:264 start_codon:yes stop_codon:yes gene_type:complete
MNPLSSLIGVRINVTLGISSHSDRTRDRINKHGSQGFIIENCVDQHKALSNRTAILLRSVAMTSDGSAWFGWLPVDEIEIIPWSEDV